MYLHEHDNWTLFTWDDKTILPLLSNVRFAQGRLIGRLEDIGIEVSQAFQMRSLCEEVVSSSRIEGIELDLAKVRSSVAQRLGIGELESTADTHDVDGAVSIVLDAIQNYDEPLSHERLFEWHTSLFPESRSGLRTIEVGQYRSTPMAVVSGPVGRERIHYVAPAAEAVPALMDEFITWFNSEPNEDLLLKAGIAHLWFVTIHPFSDGNGRMARALTEMLICRSDGSPQRLYSLASYIAANKEGYYQVLEAAQKRDADVTEWLVWFLEAVAGAVDISSGELDAVLGESAFWNSIGSISLNDRQRKVLTMLVGDFQGKLTARKWAKICKVSSDTALRDINDLIDKGVLSKDAAGGRSTSYYLMVTR